MTADFSYSLEALERRWQVEKTPQVGLRLAEEHRRKGDLEASIETLAAGLEVYPNHTASRVALSRYLVDGGRFNEAVDHLEQIVSLDPAHLVANKLLVGAYAGVGRVEDARDKLAIYEMMGEGDSDIERLRALVRDADAERAPTSLPAAAAEPSVAVEPDEGAEAAGEAVAEHRPAPRAEASTEGEEPAQGTRGFEPDPAPEETPQPHASATASEDPFAPASSADEPFGDAFGEAMEAAPPSSYWEQVADEGIFSLEHEPTEASQPRIESEPQPGEAAPDEPDTAETGDDAAPEADPPYAERPAAGSTVTLGKLYLEQGHREQAAEAFEEVLAREPDNQVARRELEAVEKPGPEAAPLDSTASPAERRRAVLTRYRDRLRKAVAAGI